MKYCIPFSSGIVLGWYWSCPLSWCMIAVLSLLSLYAGLAISRQWLSTLPSLLYLLIFLLGILKITYDAKYIPESNIRSFLAIDRSVMLEGTVTDEPRSTRTSLRFVLQCNAIVADGKKMQVEGGVLVSARKRSFDTTAILGVRYGANVLVSGKLISVGTARNPGEFDLQQYLFLNDVFARMYLDSISIEAEHSHGMMASFVHPVRRSIARRIDQLIGGEEAKFLKGLLIGERSEIDASVKSAFITAGVMHILAVSGLHVTIVVFILLVLFQTLRIPEKSRIVMTCCFLVYYNYLTGGTPSVSRSVIMAIIFLGAKLIERNHNIYNTLAFSALVLLLTDARQLFQPGFQLSYVAVFSLVYLYPKIYALKNILPKLWSNHWLVKGTVAVLAVSFAAGIGTLPFTAVYFGRVSLIGIVANIVIVPLSNVVLALGMVAVGISYISLWLGSVYAEATALLTQLLLLLVTYFGNLAYASVEAHFSIFSTIVFYLLAGGFINAMNPAVRKQATIVILLGCNVWVYGSIVLSPASNNLRVTFLDAGQGDAMLLEFPDGKTMLVDGGPKTPSYDVGAYVVVPFLRRQGIRHLDYVVVSHPHSDHLGGIPTVLRQLQVDHVIDAGSTAHSMLFTEYLHLLDSLHIQRTVLPAGSTIPMGENNRCYVLHSSSQEKSNNLNNESIVLKLCYGNTSLLLEGDAEREAEARMVKAYDQFIRSDLVKVGHHGSNTSSTPEMMDRLRPSFAVISVGENNKFHHPSPVTLERLNALHCRFIRTDQHGAVIFESDGIEWHPVEWR